MSTEAAHSILNALSVDLEEWDQAFDRLPPATRPTSRLRFGLDPLLALLDETGVRATFFVVGQLARRERSLVADLLRQGHRIASHGDAHRRLYHLTPAEFREDLRRSLATLEDASGRKVLGYRAPWFSLDRQTWWAVDALIEAGIQYDSSRFPVWNPYYGSLRCSPLPHRLETRSGAALWELPPSPTRVAGLPAPLAGGFWIRNAPVWLVRTALARWNAAGHAALLYLHPWELDPEQPLLPVSAAERAIHYWGLAGYAGRLRRILAGYRFAPVEDVFAGLWTS